MTPFTLILVLLRFKYSANPTKPDMTILREFLKKEGTLTKQQVVTLLKNACDIFSNFDSQLLEKEPNIIHMEEPVIIVGDIHG